MYGNCRQNVSNKSVVDSSRVLVEIEKYKMVEIPGGEFTMGSPVNEYGRSCDELPHSVTLNDFYMGATEVPQGLWEAVMGSNPSNFSRNNEFWGDRVNCDSLPVEKVSWNDCQLFITKLNRLTGKKFRLPTEAEWEYACRAGTSTPFSTGDSIIANQASFDYLFPYKGKPLDDVPTGRINLIGHFSPNAWGLYDMHGSVCEWCADWYGEYSEKPVKNPTGPLSGKYRLIRGGSWFDCASICRSAFRSFSTPDYRYTNLGLRLVLSK